MFLLFYVIGGVIGVLINFRFLLPSGFQDAKNAWGLLDVINTICYQLIKISLLSYLSFFLSWISVIYFIIRYNNLKSELELSRL